MSPENKERLEMLHAEFGDDVARLERSIQTIDEWLGAGHKPLAAHAAKLRELAPDLTAIADNA